MILVPWLCEVIMNWLVMICFVDLPNLTLITSVGYSFLNPRWVTLASISEYWILMVFRYSKSSKCQPTLVIPICSIEINFEYSLIDLIWFIDVFSILANLVKIKQWIYDFDLNWFDLFSDSSLFRSISIDWLIVCLFQTDSWSQFMIL